MNALRIALSALLAVVMVAARAGDATSGYDIFLLAGQSNMAGRGAVSNPIDADGQPDPANIAMWHPVNGIMPAKDPIVHTEAGHLRTGVGPGMSFAKSYLAWRRATGYPNRRVLLVGAAWGGTGFTSGGRWLPTRLEADGGDLYRAAVARANAAIAAAQARDASSRFAGILWHQGETDLKSGGSPAYAQHHGDLMKAFRGEITGALDAPIVVGEMAPCFWSQCATGVMPSATTKVAAEDLATMKDYFHHIEDYLPRAAWVTSVGLIENADRIHFDTASQRELGRRYFSKYWEAGQALPGPAVDLRVANGKLFNTGSSMDFGGGVTVGENAVRTDGNVVRQGSVATVADARMGHVVKIDRATGRLTLTVPGSLFNGSYTKMAWVKLDSNAYRNHLVSAENAGQAHYLYFSGGKLAAGHSATDSPVVVYARNPVPLPLRTWTHVAVTYDQASAAMVLYVDGVAVRAANGVPAAPPAFGDVGLDMSRYASHPQFGLDGQMIANRAYTRALSPGEISAIADFQRSSETGFGR